MRLNKSIMKLCKNEKIIYKSENHYIKTIKEEFQCDKLLITNMGKIIIEKKHTLLGPIEILIYDSLKKNKRFKVIYKSDKEVNINTEGFTEKENLIISFDIDLSDFVMAYKAVKHNPFIVYFDSYVFNINGGKFIYTDLMINGPSINLKGLRINKNHVNNYVVLGDLITLKLKDNKESIKEIEIYAFGKEFTDLLDILC